MRQHPDRHLIPSGAAALAMLIALCAVVAPGDAFAKRAHVRTHATKTKAKATRAAKAAAAAAAAAEAAAAQAAAAATPPAEPTPPTPPPPEPGDALSVYVLTMGPGDHPFFKFGHNAIWVQDRSARTDRVYNFGTFRFDSPKLLPEFIRGRLTYWLSVSSIQQTMRGYMAENRTVEVQELDLDNAAKVALKQRLDENALPENRAYKYDYFLDNCSTRVRDAIDAATGGRLRTSAQGPARLTLRGQALRLTAGVIPEYLGLYLVLGPSTDRAVDRWAEMFIPQELERGLRGVTLPGLQGQGTRPLVKAQQTLFLARRAPALERPPERAVTMLLAGLATALVFFVLGGLAAGQAMARLIFGGLISVWGLVVGFIGCFLLFVWIATDHQVVYRNQNILQCAPFAIALVVIGWGVAFGMHGATRKALIIAVAAAGLSIAGALLRLSAISPQDNGPIIAFLVPAWVGIAAGLYNIRRIQTLR
jgi:Domain of unknown function (DUF4105)